MATLPLTAQLARDQREARRQGLAMQEKANHGETLLEVQDVGREPGYVIYVYNVLNLNHTVDQGSYHLFLPACKKGEKFSFTTLPAFTKDVYLKPGSTEYMYKIVDGRKAAMSLMNPAAFPGTNFDSQLQNWQADDQQGNNLNKYGCWWSLTKPDEVEKLEGEIKLFKDRALETMNGLIREAETFAAAGDLKSISPLMHFAMDYVGQQAPWHMTSMHKINCPNCGELVNDGISYHKNAFGEKCIIDHERYEKSIARVAPVRAAVAPPEEEEEEAETVPAEPVRKTKRRT
jgi:hypothetical protein